MLLVLLRMVRVLGIVLLVVSLWRILTLGIRMVIVALSWCTAVLFVSIGAKQRIPKHALVSGVALRITCIVGPILTALLTVLKASLLGGSIRIHSGRRAIATLGITILRGRRWIALLSVRWLAIRWLAIRWLAVTLGLIVVLAWMRTGRRSCVVGRRWIVGIRHGRGYLGEGRRDGFWSHSLGGWGWMSG